MDGETWGLGREGKVSPSALPMRIDDGWFLPPLRRSLRGTGSTDMANAAGVAIQADQVAAKGADIAAGFSFAAAAASLLPTPAPAPPAAG